MNQNSCFIHISKLCNSKRKTKEDSCVSKKNNSLYVTYCENDSLDKFEADINLLAGNSSFLYFLKKRFVSIFISVISVLVILIALLSVSIYEDFLKKVIFEMPFDWQLNDYIAFIFVFVFFLGLLMMPSILDGEGNEFKNLISSWFNKDVRKLRKLELALSNFDKKMEIHLYNFDLEDSEHWIWKIFTSRVVNRFSNINFYIRNDKLQTIIKRVNKFEILNLEVIKSEKIPKKCDVEILLSSKEQKLYSLMQLCSTVIAKQRDKKTFISLELFEYCGKNFIKEENDSKNQLIFGFQNFINRSFDDFKFLVQEKSLQVFFTQNVIFKDLSEEEKRLAYYLRNHIEECIERFENPISLLILYYYVKDIVLDKRRTIKILEKFISSVKNKQQYELINFYWFEIAGFMFDFNDVNTFESSNNSYYRKISIEALNDLAFLFERNGHFEQAILLNQYLYEINPNKYALNICSLYERMGKFEQAYNSLPKELNLGKNTKPTDIEIRYYQRKAAWVIISQRNEDLKEEGIESLNKLETLLFSHNEDNVPLWLWHFYNIKANLKEWEENYDEAIIFYKKCLSIPTLGAFEYGATFVNMAISYRCKYIEESIKDEKIIDKSIKLGRLGMILKESVGDRDEMPVVLHNFALNILYKISNSFDINLCNEVLTATNDALEILERTKSIKRLGMVLIENYISKSLLKIDTKDIVLKLENHLPNLGQSELKQLLNIYKEFEKNNKMKKLEFLEGRI
ncbi:MAG: tetratricopeptide repeat protein [Arcobacter sp.]|uniref:tetratricopeptide repeat protein n=1 Tax=Arcobacter sp. TaxID=1872629 RepID=UPI003D05EA02